MKKFFNWCNPEKEQRNSTILTFLILKKNGRKIIFSRFCLFVYKKFLIKIQTDSLKIDYSCMMSFQIFSDCNFTVFNGGLFQ